MTPFDESALQRAMSGSPDWLAERRREGFEHFEKLAPPSSKEEVWRYVDLDFELESFSLPTEPGRPLARDDVLGSALGDVTGAAHVVDGFVTSIESDGPVELESLRTASFEKEELLADLFAAGVPADLDRFAAAHRAFGTDGVVLAVPNGRAVTAPFYVDVQAATPGGVSFPHVLIDVGESSQASVVVNYRSPQEQRSLVIPRLEVRAGANANLKLTVVQNFGYATHSLSHARLVAGRDATVRLAEAGLGGKLSRLHLTVDLDGQGSNAEVIGAYFGEETQTLDYRYFMHHAGENTHSDMFLKGGVEDEALSVFTGMIRIDETAQRTDAFQTNRNLLLSEGAAAQSVPNLEILANDVRCGHGSTVGPLDEEQRYYLMSRGLDRSRADRLQVRGFFAEALARFPEPAVAGPVGEWINRKYVAAQKEGRV